MNDSESWRMFFAVSVPSHFHRALTKLQCEFSISSQKLAGSAEGAKRPTAGDEGCEVRAQNLAPLLHPEGGHVPPFIKKLQFSREWKLVKSHQFHITLAFLGNVSVQEISRIENAGEKAASVLAPFSASLSNLSGFPNPYKARVGILHVESESLKLLADSIRKNLLETDYDSKPFNSHLTLARARHGKAVVPAGKISKSWEINEFHLIRSELKSDGPKYTIHRSFPLACIS